MSYFQEKYTNNEVKKIRCLRVVQHDDKRFALKSSLLYRFAPGIL